MYDCKKSVFIFFLLTVIFHSTSLTQANDTDYKAVDPEKTLDILELLVSDTKANFEKIKTWEGRITTETITSIRGEMAAEIFDTYTDAKPKDSLNEIQQIIKKSVEYKIDMKNNRFTATANVNLPSDLFITMTIYADANGTFTFGIPKAGQWGFAALGVGEKTEFKGKELSQDAVIWVQAHDFKAVK